MNTSDYIGKDVEVKMVVETVNVTAMSVQAVIHQQIVNDRVYPRRCS
jgi:hypothetical protein